MRTVAYCRVSTNKEEQLESLESQQKFFDEYAKKNGCNLVKIYADEGKSGTKIKNRTQLLRLLSDAKDGLFDLVLIKDVSRLARNTVDFLVSIRKLKALNIEVRFVNNNFTSSECSEFTLTLLSAIAQEESANTSKRVKFGKKQNAERGRVPNFVYGYDKVPGDYFNLNVNEDEAKTVRRIFNLYTQESHGANRIAAILNSEGILTKRGCKWSQNAISRILTNEIYIGKIINGKQEVADFLTGKRREKNENDWYVVDRPELKIIDDVVYEKAQRILQSRTNLFIQSGERNSERYVFSKLIRCACCGYAFRRIERKYQNTYVTWVCSGRNANGADSCPNKTVIKENELLQAIREYFIGVLSDKPNVMNQILTEFNRQFKSRDENIVSKAGLTARLSQLKKSKANYITMFENEIISIEELKGKTKEINAEMDELNQELKLVALNISKSDLLKNLLEQTFEDMEHLLKDDHISHSMLSRIIEKITVEEGAHIDIYLKLFNELGLENNFTLMYDHT
ncbi:recombinase family protein [Acetanaerobacterium elongatum]|uniref:Site-specific DNA recombinase n=1 Tax=Acetanaerobacterium elongatum TaxID=258515 RepID=A0A1H0CFD5_9FIRM|nr:recombinase family protein [Acetanaerobacterium elongatum]SDN56589.1 Site-specific DNA recombinase [Acetanaerobacterium elongatum]